MESEKIELEVTQEMKDLMIDYKVNSQCRDVCIVSIFKTKKAIQYGRDGEKCRIKFWNLANQLFPQYEASAMTYDFTREILKANKQGES